MKTTKYLLIKYIADVHRFEPRNIGVIVCSSEGAEARFAGEHTARLGEVDGRSIPNFVTSGVAYKQWVQYWRGIFNAGRVTVPESGKVVEVTSQDFAAALEATSRGNFVIVDAGSVLEDVSAEELPALADQLYGQLVDTRASDEPSDADLDAVANGILDRIGLRSHRNFHQNYPVQCTVNGVQEEYVFSDAFANGSLQRLYQRLPIPKSKVRLRKNVHDTAWSFEHVLKQGVITSEHSGVLVNVSEEQRSQPDVEKSLRLLGSITRVINLAEPESAQEEFKALAALPEH